MFWWIRKIIQKFRKSTRLIIQSIVSWHVCCMKVFSKGFPMVQNFILLTFVAIKYHSKVRLLIRVVTVDWIYWPYCRCWLPRILKCLPVYGNNRFVRPQYARFICWCCCCCCCCCCCLRRYKSLFIPFEERSNWKWNKKKNNGDSERRKKGPNRP